MCSMSAFQRPTGKVSQVLGTIESSGNVDNGGTSLRGRVVVVALVRLPDGNEVQIGIPTSEPISPGSQVMLKVFPQNFGPPRYGFTKLFRKHQP